MLFHNTEAEKILLALPEGTAVIVKGITGVLVFSPYPENYQEIKDTVYKYIMACDPWGDDEDEQLANGLYDCLEEYKEQENDLCNSSHVINKDTPPKEHLHIFHKYHNEYEFGIQHLQQEDNNVFPRDYGKPSVAKGTTVVCYEYSADVYEITLNIKE